MLPFLEVRYFYIIVNFFRLPSPPSTLRGNDTLVIGTGVGSFDHDSDVDEIEELAEAHDAETQEEIL